MYQVIARKHRPRDFSGLIGQEHVRATLSHAIEKNRIAHGYILAGQRGTGKTTVARIVARCLNCENVAGPTASPCGKCSSCLEVNAGNSVDVIEIDAASNRGINEMRELRENVRYRPARDRYKVFIIDEAHQITNEAFNALLKTLEEPPEWVVFILCTTEVHKIPTTIASRCQQFSFRSVDFVETVDHMRRICEIEGVQADDEVLSVLALAGEGSVRDSLSALDQAIACCGATLDVVQVRGLLGMFSLDSLEQVADGLETSNPSRMLEVVYELERNGLNLQHFCRELARYFRNLLVSKVVAASSGAGLDRLVAASPSEREKLAATAAKFSEEDLTRYLQLTLDLFKDMQFSLQPRLHLEIGLLRLVYAGRLQPIEEALAGIGGGGGSKPAPAPRTPPAAAPKSTPVRFETVPRPAVVSAPKPVAVPASNVGEPLADGRGSVGAALPVPRPAVVSAPKPVAVPASNAGEPLPDGRGSVGAALPGTHVVESRLQAQLMAALEELGMLFTVDAVAHSIIEESASEVSFTTPKEFRLAMKDADIVKALQHIGRRVKVKIVFGETGVVAARAPAAERKAPDEEEAMHRALENPEVQRFQQAFPGAQIRAVRNLKE